MKVRAIQTGYFDGLHIPGTESELFVVPDGENGSWFEPAEPGDQAEAKKATRAAKGSAPAEPGDQA